MDTNTPDTPAATAPVVNAAPVTTPQAPTAASVVATPAAAGNPDAWYGKFGNPDLRGFAELKGWQSPEDAVSSVANLEKIIDAEKAGKTLVMPDFNNPDEVNKFFDKLGRPANVKDYDIKAPEGDTSGFADAMAQVMHEKGLTKEQAQSLYGKYNEVAQAAAERQAQARLQQSENEMKSLFNEWGINKDANVELTRRVTNALGLDTNTLDGLESALGSKGLMNLLHKIGNGMGEERFAGNAATPLAMSKEGAGAKIQQLMADQDFTKRLMAGDSKAKNEWSMLHQIKHGN